MGYLLSTYNTLYNYNSMDNYDFLVPIAFRICNLESKNEKKAGLDT